MGHLRPIGFGFDRGLWEERLSSLSRQNRVTLRSRNNFQTENHLAGLPPPCGGGVRVSLRTCCNPKEAEMKYSAIDLHSNNSVVVVSDEADRVLVRRRLPNDAAAMLAVLAAHRDERVGVVVESTYYACPGIMHGLYSKVRRGGARIRA